MTAYAAQAQRPRRLNRPRGRARFWSGVVIVSLRPPRRPEPTDPRARRVVEWADVLYYIFWLTLSAVVVVVALVSYGPSILH